MKINDIVEELLKPRYKCIADWPGNTKIEIMSILKGYSPGCGGGELIRNDKGETVWLSPENYPHLFKKLEWFEDREEKDMPEYVKVNTEKSSLFIGNVHKVKSWAVKPDQVTCRLIEEKTFPYDYFASHFLPIQKEEFNNQNKKQW